MTISWIIHHFKYLLQRVFDLPTIKLFRLNNHSQKYSLRNKSIDIKGNDIAIFIKTWHQRYLCAISINCKEEATINAFFFARHFILLGILFCKTFLRESEFHFSPEKTFRMQMLI